MALLTELDRTAETLGCSLLYVAEGGWAIVGMKIFWVETVVLEKAGRLVAERLTVGI